MPQLHPQSPSPNHHKPSHEQLPPSGSAASPPPTPPSMSPPQVPPSTASLPKKQTLPSAKLSTNTCGFRTNSQESPSSAGAPRGALGKRNRGLDQPPKTAQIFVNDPLSEVVQKGDLSTAVD
ncbi:hypothetical protein BGX38DRAFT_1273803 [Terfezia claveryi]|nr:hypothetical protein BGX38DRAFT_1273803 [Terfezia claveryi]